ncbi:MAG: MFS transporter, partial [Glaciimonas sp.]|nr:MFS transporter [Glaciimonas sp.]
PTANILIAIALLLATPFFVIFGTLSDKIGRKPIIMAGCLIAALTYFPIFSAITHYANPALEAAQKTAPVIVTADPNACQFQFNPTGTKKFTSSCDIAKAKLASMSVNYQNVAGEPGSVATIKVGDKILTAYDANGLSKEDAAAKDKAFTAELSGDIKEAGYPSKADPAQINKPMVLLLLFILVLYVTMVYGPIAAMLVEMFPTRIRYTSMSMPYHIGNGWFGGLLPTMAFAMVALKGDIYYGLWYPIIIALATFVIGMLFVKETKDNDIYAADFGDVKK